jgi:hypothetical protein
VIGFVVLAAGAIGMAGWLNAEKSESKQKDALEESSEKQSSLDPDADPFGGLHEEPPSRSGTKLSTTMRTTNKAPEGLTRIQLWLDACKLAAGADLHAQNALAAKEEGDHKLFNSEGKLAQDGYDKAFNTTVAWEAEILDDYGQMDRQVRTVVRKRGDWSKQLMFFHKTTSQ